MVDALSGVKLSTLHRSKLYSFCHFVLNAIFKAVEAPQKIYPYKFPQKHLDAKFGVLKGLYREFISTTSLG